MYTELCILLSVIALSLGAPASPLETCQDSCQLPKCRCSSTDVPGGLDPKQIPQIVLLTFDDAVQSTNYDFYKYFEDKKNPDGCPISTTYFVSHEYTEYPLVHDLYMSGHEIAVHSITHQANTTYWQTASVDLLKKEFGGDRDIITTFAGVDPKHIYGMRIPFLQMSGNNSVEAAKQLGLEYDCSWPTQTYRSPGLWPYSLDYLSTQDCPIGPCPTESLPGVWIQPMIDLIDNDGNVCAMSDACPKIPDDVDGIYKFIYENFMVQYNDTRAIFGFYVHAAWFLVNENRFEAYKKFIDYLVGQDDVYIVDVHRGLEWVRNPNTLANIKKTWPECNKPTPSKCTPTVCKLEKDGQDRYLHVCGECPQSYPWLDNPFGNKTTS